MAFPNSRLSPHGKVIHYRGQFMTKICGEIVLKRSKEHVFSDIIAIDFAARLDPRLATIDRRIVFQNERVLRTVSLFEGIGSVEMEYVYIPEKLTVVTQRRPPLAPFVYLIAFQMLHDHPNGALLRWVEEFEIDADNQSNEKGIASRFERNEIQHFQKVQDYYESNDS